MLLGIALALLLAGRVYSHILRRQWQLSDMKNYRILRRIFTFRKRTSNAALIITSEYNRRVEERRISVLFKTHEMLIEALIRLEDEKIMGVEKELCDLMHKASEKSKSAEAQKLFGKLKGIHDATVLLYNLHQQGKQDEDLRRPDAIVRPL